MSSEFHALVEQLQHPNPSERSRAVFALDGLGSSDAQADALLGALSAEPDFYVREDIVWALVSSGERVIAPLIRLLKHVNPAVRHQAAHALGKIGDTRAVDALIAALQDTDIPIVIKIIQALGQMRDPRALPALNTLLGHESRDVQEMLTTALVEFGTTAVEPLVGALAHPRWQAREQAADILGLIDDASVTPVLIGALHDAEWQVRLAAVNALGVLSNDDARQALSGMGEDSNPRVRSLAAHFSIIAPRAGHGDHAPPRHVDQG